MNDINSLRYLFKLKKVYRTGRVEERMESTAEHTYSALLLAKYFNHKFDYNLDMLKVYEILLFHDLVEIETNDIFILDEEGRKNKHTKEADAAKVIAQKLPQELGDEFCSYFEEYEQRLSREDKFAKAIDTLDPMIHWLDYKEDWKKFGFNEKNIRELKEKHLQEFPELLEFFNQLIDYLKENKYID